MFIWPRLIHISSTTHEKFMTLDFLEMGEQDLQLSCWTKFHLNHFWWCNLEEKTFPFLAILNYKSLSIFGKFCPDFIFFNVDVWNVKWDLFEHEWSISNHFPPPNPTVDLTVDFCGWQMTWTFTDDSEPQPLDEMAPKWNPGLYKLHKTTWWSPSHEDLISLKNPDRHNSTD